MKQALLRLLTSTPFDRLFGRWTAGRLPILMLHRFTERPQEGRTSAAALEAFLQQAADRGWQGWRLDQVIAALDAGELPSRTFCLTVDDGYRDFAEVAFPILQRYGVPATVFLTTDFVDGTMWNWWDRVIVAFQRSGAAEATGFAHPFHAIEAWKQIPEAEKRQRVAELEAAVGASTEQAPEAVYQAMSWETIAQLAAAGIEFGGHTQSHPILSQIDDVQLEQEIGGSLQTIERHLGAPVRTFAYPNGRAEDFDERAVRMLQATPLVGAVTTEARFLTIERGSDRWRIPRLVFPETALGQRSLLCGLEAAKESWRS